ncbi:hypothetical protein FMM05_07360 [Flavobacterium zepuense]|uniref:Porin n=1 Tax=Flavobacterium zepuense TaxID=2593302 RepID=A0A552V3Q7_9FLAO|nr:putative porin [Flavobacterium zepuense]TRW25120.1 hypothetical protein FMM05_07360 [Flavobacterium zepuense]
MLKNIGIIVLLLLPEILFSQVRPEKKVRSSGNIANNVQSLPDRSTGSKKDTITSAADTIATIDMYKIITLQRDTILVDTTLTIQKEYEVNYLKRDNFGLLAFPNDGQTYNVLDYGLTKFNPFPEFGFTAKHSAYERVDDINYYEVATPYTDLMYRSVQRQGQILSALFTVNTSPNLNLFVGYKGVRSIGKYINARSSNGNFKIGGSYNTKDKRYFLKLHFTGQDFTNQENGGIIDTNLFDTGDPLYTDREKLDVYFRDAESFLKGNRYFIDHTFRLSKSNPNSLVFHHQFNFENEYFTFTQPTVSSKFGEAYTTSIDNKTRYNRMYNLIGAAYANKTIGTIEFYLEDFKYNYFYYTTVLNSGGVVAIPNALNDRIDNYGARYTYHKDKWKGTALISNSITDQSLTNIDLQARYSFDEQNVISVLYQNMNKLPNHNYNLYQSDYKFYNWSNNFNNEKINSLEVEAKTKWATASLQYTILKDHLYFSNDWAGSEDTSVYDSLMVSPKQYAGTINYLSLKVSKEFKWWKLALDNTLLYQNVEQTDNILNVPSFVTRNTLYYTDHLFKRALLIQTGFTFQYFSKYYGNDYNPLLGEFYVQDNKKFGDFPMIDFFLNMKIQEFRLFLKAEHFNSSFTGYNYYSAPNTPYRDFTVRFGIVWNFFS